MMMGGGNEIFFCQNMRSKIVATAAARPSFAGLDFHITNVKALKFPPSRLSISQSAAKSLPKQLHGLERGSGGGRRRRLLNDALE